MYYAVFEDGSHQYRVSEGDVVRVDYRDAEVGDREGRAPPVRHDDDGGGRSPGRVDHIAVEGRGGRIDQQGGVAATRRQAGPDLVGREALDELGRDGGGVGPSGDVGKPGGPRRGQAQQDETLAAHDPAGAGPGPVPSECSAATRVRVPLCSAATRASTSRTSSMDED